MGSAKLRAVGRDSRFSFLCSWRFTLPRFGRRRLRACSCNQECGDPHTASAQRNHPHSPTLLCCSWCASRVTVRDSSLFSCPEHTPSSRCFTACTRATFSRRAVASWWMPSGAHKTLASPMSMYLQVRGEEDVSHHMDLQDKHCAGSEIMRPCPNYTPVRP